MDDLNVPAGWRVRGDDEVVEQGDRYWSKNYKLFFKDACLVPIGSTTLDALSRYTATAIITQKPLPVKPIFPGGDMLWVNYPIEQRREFNRAAYEALDAQDVEMFERFTGTWKPASQVSLFFQYRVKPPEPMVRWLVITPGGSESISSTGKCDDPAYKVIKLVETPE